MGYRRAIRQTGRLTDSDTDRHSLVCLANWRSWRRIVLGEMVSDLLAKHVVFVAEHVVVNKRA